MERVILFDGVCNLCNAWVQRVIRNDKRRRFRYASLQSAYGQQVVAAHFTQQVPDTLIYQRNGRVYTRSGAALRIMRDMDRAWPVLYWAFIGVPPFIRNGVYRLIARKRYVWFGKRESCMIPTPELAPLFLD
jgi:predicted DCC family thiol-disulfide oxidoreductase YuxK